MEPVRIRLAVRVRGIEGDGAQEGIVFSSRNPDFVDAVAARVGPRGEELGPHGRAIVVSWVSVGRRYMGVVDQPEVLADDHDLPQPVQGALFGAGEGDAAVERPGADGARTEPPDADGGLAYGPGRGAVEQLRAVVVGAGPGGGAVERVRLADTVPGIGLVSPGAVVEVRVVVGDPGAVEPVDRHAPVGWGPGGVGKQPGVMARHAHQRHLPQCSLPPGSQEITCFNDVKGGVNSEVVVVLDARAGGCRQIRINVIRVASEVQKAEGVANSEVVGDQRVVGKDRFGTGRGDGLGGRGPGAGTIAVEGKHLDVVIPVWAEAGDDEGGVGGVVLAHGRPIDIFSVADVVSDGGGLAGVFGSGPGDRQRAGAAGCRHHDHISDGARGAGIGVALHVHDQRVAAHALLHPRRAVLFPVEHVGEGPTRLPVLVVRLRGQDVHHGTGTVVLREHHDVARRRRQRDRHA